LKPTVVIANTGVFAALAVLLTFVKAELPYPLLPYLKFDLAEVPITLLLFLQGPIPSLIAAVIHWIALSVARGWVLGPLMKFLAVVPMILGNWIGIETFRRVFQKRNLTVVLVVGSVIGALFRILATSATNIIVLLWVAPDFLKFAGSTLRALGLVVGSSQEVLLWTLLLTGVFNGLHVLLSAAIAVFIVRGAAFKIPWVAQNAWMFHRPK